MTTNEIYEEIADEKDNQAALSGLLPNNDTVPQLLDSVNSPSKTAHWRLFAFIVADAIFRVRTFWEIFKAEVLDTIAKYQPGTLRWYQIQALEWQYGYQLDYINRKYQYAVIDENARIVKRCSATEPGGVVRIKAAKLSGSTIVPLSTAELVSLQAYFQKIKYPGKVLVVSPAADLLKLIGTVYFDALVDVPTLKTNVEAAVNNYLANIDYDGKFNITKLIDYIQKVPGVIDFTIQTIEAKYGSIAYTPIIQEYQTNAGYIAIDTVNHPLNSSLTYTPYV